MKVELSPIERRHIRDALDTMVTSGYPQSWHDLRARFLPLAAAYQPGSTVPESGIYIQVDREYKAVGENATCVKGEPFPPTNEYGYSWMSESPTDGVVGE